MYLYMYVFIYLCIYDIDLFIYLVMKHLCIYDVSLYIYEHLCIFVFMICIHAFIYIIYICVYISRIFNYQESLRSLKKYHHLQALLAGFFRRNPAWPSMAKLQLVSSKRWPAPPWSSLAPWSHGHLKKVHDRAIFLAVIPPETSL